MATLTRGKTVSYPCCQRRLSLNSVHLLSRAPSVSLVRPVNAREPRTVRPNYLRRPFVTSRGPPEGFAVPVHLRCWLSSQPLPVEPDPAAPYDPADHPRRRRARLEHPHELAVVLRVVSTISVGAHDEHCPGFVRVRQLDLYVLERSFRALDDWDAREDGAEALGEASSVRLDADLVGGQGVEDQLLRRPVQRLAGLVAEKLRGCAVGNPASDEEEARKV